MTGVQTCALPIFWIAHTELPRTVAHPFYEQLNRVLVARGCDEWVEQQCARFYAERMGRPKGSLGAPEDWLLRGERRLLRYGYTQKSGVALSRDARFVGMIGLTGS